MKNLIHKILKEETESLDNSILNFLRRRVKLETKSIGPYKDTDPIIMKFIIFNLGDEWLTLRDNESKKDKIGKILNMLESYNVINLGEYNPNIFDTERQKVIRTIKYFLNTIEFEQ